MLADVGVDIGLDFGLNVVINAGVDVGIECSDTTVMVSVCKFWFRIGIQNDFGNFFMVVLDFSFLIREPQFCQKIENEPI